MTGSILVAVEPMRAMGLFLIALLAAGCRSCDGTRIHANAPAARLVAPTYADQQPDPPANPTGAYWEGERLWVWSDSHRVQHSYARAHGVWQAGPVREGPIGTQRCVVGRDALGGDTFCVGRYQNGGLVAFADGSNAARNFGALPRRAGFRDLVLMHELGLVGVLDSVTHQLVWLDRAGARVGQSALPASSYRIGPVADDQVFVLSGTAPQLVVLRIAADASSQALFEMQRRAPLRDAHYDEVHDLLWIAGPEDHAVRRNTGPIEHLGSGLAALDGAALRHGETRVQVQFDLAVRGFADPTRLTSHAGKVFASLTGSDRLAWLECTAGNWELHATSTGSGPAGLASEAGLLAVAARLDDAVYIYEIDDGHAATIAIDHRARDSARDLGERLFYGAFLWSQASKRPFTCNSCHWDTESDRRQHPGLRETRLEQTRPLGGVAALEPLFTPGQAHTLDEAVDGLIRVLDDEYWRDSHYEERTLALRVKGGGLRRLGPLDTRRALVAFLASVPVSPGPYLRADVAELRALIARGAQLFVADCADCHAARDQGGTAVLRSAEGLLDTLRSRPLVLGAHGFAQAGAGPNFTELGNRISPLMGLSRGGPYFASGSAPDLRAVLSGFVRTRPNVHAANDAGVYDPEQLAALEAFLNTL